MTRNEASILAKLSPLPPHQPSWRTPKQFGAAPGSHHSMTAARMVEKAWVERRQRCCHFVDGPRQRPSWEYRITAFGRQALANHVMILSIAVVRAVSAEGPSKTA